VERKGGLKIWRGIREEGRMEKLGSLGGVEDRRKWKWAKGHVCIALATLQHSWLCG